MGIKNSLIQTQLYFQRQIYVIATQIQFADCENNVILVYDIFLDTWKIKTTQYPCDLGKWLIMFYDLITLALKFILLEGKLKNFFGSLYIVKLKEDVPYTSIVEFTKLITNTTETLASVELNYDAVIVRKMENFIMKPTFQDTSNAGGCDPGLLTDNAFETTEFLNRNIFKVISLE